jgi:hypothetical protein
MNDLDARAFAALFKEACRKCFGHGLTHALSETESRLFSEKVLDQTGLVIGAKSIKNYSLYVLTNGEGREENPSIATLDTLARYISDAPPTDEVQRKNKESHYPYWFHYKAEFRRSSGNKKGRRTGLVLAGIFLSVAIVATSMVLLLPAGRQAELFEDHFQSVADDSLASRGWLVGRKDEGWWSRRGESHGLLSLFTLKGDNWPDTGSVRGINNLLLRKISAECFTAETRLSDFIPLQNWQQAGILLMEDTGFRGKSMRISFVYNNFFGGFAQQPEIILQAITSAGKENMPEEFFHKSLFKLEKGLDSLVVSNMKRSAIRVEKRGNQFRVLYSNSPVENFAFKEGITQEFSFEPNYIGLFAIKGHVDSSAIIPARFNFFSFREEKCE